jgi:hypothetical protein
MPLCDKHGHVYGDGCKCPDCEQESKVVDVPIPEGDDNPEVGFLENEGKKRGKGKPKDD